ncbi:MAG: hypothetical protein PHN51_01700 [Candidatus Nanopelagicales bacterium]|nr:hypothetical protein [Candidatus Nanopelagicales bacterium]
MISILADAQSAQVTNWPLRLLLVAATLLVIAGLLALMRWGWKGRERRQIDVSRPLPVPPHDATFVIDIPGVYIGAARAGDWLDRIVVHGLGVRSRAALNIGERGLWVERVHANSFFVPADEINRVRIDRGIAGTVRSKDSVIVVTFALGTTLVDFGFRPDEDAGRDVIVRACIDAGFNVDELVITKEQS